MEIKVWKTLFSVPGDGHLAYSMLLYVPRDGNPSKSRSGKRYFTLIAESTESAQCSILIAEKSAIRQLTVTE